MTALVTLNERLQYLLPKLQHQHFGQKSERLSDEQLLFAFEEIEATLAENTAAVSKVSRGLRDNHAKRRREGRGTGHATDLLRGYRSIRQCHD